jgi:lipooligosaccharide transport system ATP-binding protein
MAIAAGGYAKELVMVATQQAPARDLPEEVIVARGLTKTYGDVPAVRGVDFTIHRGECFAFLGPNGAGKSSTIRMLSCLSPRSGGELQVLALPADIGERRIKERLGIVAQDDNVDPDLSLMENLLVYARYFGMPAGEAKEHADALLAFMQLEGRSRAAVRELSGGMRRRLVIARALMHRPDILVLDEPTTGLDPQARLLVWGAVQQLKSQGVTIVLTTHYMEEAERLADRLVVMDHGRILEEDAPRPLIERTVGREAVKIWQQEGEDDAACVAAAGDGLLLSDRHGDTLVLYSAESGRIGQAFARHGLSPQRMLVRPTNLEDVFLTLTGRDLRE